MVGEKVVESESPILGLTTYEYLINVKADC